MFTLAKMYIYIVRFLILRYFFVYSFSKLVFTINLNNRDIKPNRKLFNL